MHGAPRLIGLTLAATLALGAPAADAGGGGGTLEAGDVGLTVVSEPHASTILVVDSVGAGCGPGDTSEHDGRVVSFAESPDAPSSGAQLNQVVFDFGSAGAAKAFFAGVRAYEQERVKCGKTNKASGLKLSKGPSGVGDARFTVISNEQVGGVTRKVVSIPILTGSTVTRLIFLDWDTSLPATTAVAKKAVSRIG